jgi:dipeptidyl aminopeptidase/acylaminoacyl peptidase
MLAQQPLPFGSWPSPVTADLIAGSNIRLGQVALRGADIFWSEGRPQEQGRNVLVHRHVDGSMDDVNPAPFDVRTRVHEYGGGAFALLPDGVAFSNFSDQQVYCIRDGAAPQQLTLEPSQRYADMVFDASRNRLIAVREDHTGAGEAVASLVSVLLESGAVQVLVHGHDFFSSPTLNFNASQLAWLSWDHPNMPWDGTDLWVADVASDGSLKNPRLIAGGPAESIFQPMWSPEGELHFVSDRSGWWNLYRWHDEQIHALHPMAADFGKPQWAFGMSTYGFDEQGRIVCEYLQNGLSHLAMLDGKNATFQKLPTPFCVVEGLRVGRGYAAFIGASPTHASELVRLDLDTGEYETLRQSSTQTLDPLFASRAEAITFPTEAGAQAHAFFYPPVNRDHCGAKEDRPPLIVMSHGGPTACSDASFKWALQYWTSRGFAVVDVNYGGSSGYGRVYRERLNGKWGIVDVDDSINAARFLIARGDVDSQRVVIRGGSAGGYTTLCALTFRRFFKAGASHYGIGDLESLVSDTHKFESRYLDRLIGPYPASKDVYHERSPIHFTHQLASPMILFQGAQDKAVPPEQARSMFDAVKAKGLPVAYLLFEGEQHGFRRAATIKRVLEAELYFYGRVFGFSPADIIEVVEISNLASVGPQEQEPSLSP